MVSYFHEQESLLHNPIFDALYCEEERFDECAGGGGFALKESEIEDFNEIQQKPFAFLFEHDLFWEDDELATLLSKEKKQARLSDDNVIISDGSLKVVRNEAVKWMLKVIGYYGFNAMTALLSVNYYDRFVTSRCFQKDKPWMSQLAAVACLSIAAKVEETQVPLLLDLQVEESKYLFEAKTIQRMELLVLSTLQWKMNPVTPVSFFDHIARRFGLITNLHWEFLRRCESVILSIITDCRLVHYLPSVIAAAAMIYVIGEIENCDAVEYQNQLMSVLGTSKEKVDICHKLILEAMDDLGRNSCHKRKHESVPSSPSGVIDAYFSSDNSVDSWAVASSVSSSPEPLFKRSRA
ncbi:Cyclin-D3-3 [Sesamum alatum]|uniref:Cyclin-D3-3 n=1 Tax=Sesamum alatum TaxID=300844 RepID=A0AAE1XT42_9LAMI|nr:Cyclin-D3-3 [Sesamum alatum]